MTEKIDYSGITKSPVAVYSVNPEDIASFISEDKQMADAFGSDVKATIKHLPIYI